MNVLSTTCTNAIHIAAKMTPAKSHVTRIISANVSVPPNRVPKCPAPHEKPEKPVIQSKKLWVTNSKLVTMEMEFLEAVLVAATMEVVALVVVLVVVVVVETKAKIARTMMKVVIIGLEKGNVTIILSSCFQIVPRLVDFVKIVETRAQGARSGPIEENALKISGTCILIVMKLVSCVRTCYLIKICFK